MNRSPHFSGSFWVHPDSRLPEGTALFSTGEGKQVMVNLGGVAAPSDLGRVHFDPSDFDPLPALQRAQLLWGYADVLDGGGEGGGRWAA